MHITLTPYAQSITVFAVGLGVKDQFGGEFLVVEIIPKPTSKEAVDYTYRTALAQPLASTWEREDCKHRVSALRADHMVLTAAWMSDVEVTRGTTDVTLPSLDGYQLHAFAGMVFLDDGSFSVKTAIYLTKNPGDASWAYQAFTAEVRQEFGHQAKVRYQHKVMSLEVAITRLGLDQDLVLDMTQTQRA